MPRCIHCTVSVRAVNSTRGGTVSAAFALASALSFGAADFIGGLAARRAPVIPVTALSQAVGLAVLAPPLLFLGGALSAEAAVTGAVAGVAGSLGLAVYFRALAIGPMSVVSPLAAVVSAGIPVGAGVAMGEQPSASAVAGIVVGLAAVVLTTRTPALLQERRPSPAGPLLALASGGAFGVFFVALDAAPADSGMWPLAAARVASLLLLAAITVARGTPLPSRAAIPMVAASGALDMLANVLFLLATRTGLLALTAFLASLYPVVVVILARRVLAERLAMPQIAGVLLALVAVALVAVG